MHAPPTARTAISHSRSEYGSPPPPVTPSSTPSTAWYGRLRYTVVEGVHVGVGVLVDDCVDVGDGVEVGVPHRARSPTRSSQRGGAPDGLEERRTPEVRRWERV